MRTLITLAICCVLTGCGHVHAQDATMPENIVGHVTDGKDCYRTGDEMYCPKDVLFDVPPIYRNNDVGLPYCADGWRFPIRNAKGELHCLALVVKP